MQVAAHPHTGLQTVTWLFSGTVLHHDSLGSESQIRPGELNLMTAGHGIAHSEISLDSEEALEGVQLWVILPESSRDRSPEFRHYKDLPRFTFEGAQITLFMGDLLERRSPATAHSPILGAEIHLEEGSIHLPLNSQWEHGVLVISPSASINGDIANKGQLFFSPIGSDSLSIEVDPNTDSPVKVILIGGEPYREKFVMWWNFIGRSHEEIVKMREDWESRTNRFPAFADSLSDRVPAPEMPNLRLTPR